MKEHYFSSRTKMADMIAVNQNLILMLPRLSIPLGFGEKNVQEICAKCQLSVNFVLLICNIYTFDDYVPDLSALSDDELGQLVPYLRASHRYYLQERLPHISRHLNHVSDQAGEKYARVLRNFFEDYQQEVKDHFECEEKDIFPYLVQLQNGNCPTVKASRHFADNHSDLVDMMSDLMQIVYKYLPGDSLVEELNELVFSIMQLSLDLQKHALIEERVLLPYIQMLERRLS